MLIKDGLNDKNCINILKFGFRYGRLWKIMGRIQKSLKKLIRIENYISLRWMLKNCLWKSIRNIKNEKRIRIEIRNVWKIKTIGCWLFIRINQ